MPFPKLPIHCILILALALFAPGCARTQVDPGQTHLQRTIETDQGQSTVRTRIIIQTHTPTPPEAP